MIGRWTPLAFIVLLATGCGSLFGERVPPSMTSQEVKRVTFQIVARSGRCEPSVLAADREGRGLLIVFEVTSVDGDHYFLVSDVGIRKLVPAGTQVVIPYLADQSGIFDIACTSSRIMTPLTAKGRLAIR